MAKKIWYQTANERVSRMPYRWQHRAGSVAITAAIMTSLYRDVTYSEIHLRVSDHNGTRKFVNDLLARNSRVTQEEKLK